MCRRGKTADLSTASLQVRVVGTAAQVSRLTGDSVFCTVDLSSIGDQSGNLEVPVTGHDQQCGILLGDRNVHGACDGFERGTVFQLGGGMIRKTPA